MCGIVGAVSTRNIVPVLVQGLQRLEYRGYDSCGVAVHRGATVDGAPAGVQAGLDRARSTARVSELQQQVDQDQLVAGTGIATGVAPSADSSTTGRPATTPSSAASTQRTWACANSSM